MKNLLATFLLVIPSIVVSSQTTKPDLVNSSNWETHNRNEVVIGASENDAFVRLDAQKGDGLTIYKNLEFENGTIELDIRGKDNPGKSFVGLAFHIQNEKTFNAVYFRPFNFKSSDKARSGHSVQYISHPEFTWHKLRGDFPEQYENPVKPIPEPNEFFHAKVVVQWPKVTVFVDGSTEPSLEVEMLSKFKKGKIGFWVGNGSDGDFKNLAITN